VHLCWIGTETAAVAKPSKQPSSESSVVHPAVCTTVQFSFSRTFRSLSKSVCIKLIDSRFPEFELRCLCIFLSLRYVLDYCNGLFVEYRKIFWQAVARNPWTRCSAF